MAQSQAKRLRRPNFFTQVAVDLKRNPGIYLMLIPVVLYYLIFCYAPMGGLLIAFKDFSPRLGILKSDWVGFLHFTKFFNSIYFTRLLRNTLLLNVYNVIFGFPAPILLALFMDEVRHVTYKRVIQTVSYLPHFVSLVVICGMIKEFVAREGLINYMATLVNPAYAPASLLNTPKYFRSIYVVSEIWQGIGWNSIIYLASLSGVDPQLYEAVTIDGGNRFHRVWHISIPSIMPTIVILFILRMGSMMNVGFEKVMLLYSEPNYLTSDVISTYVYRKGLLDNQFSFATAIGLFNSVINFVLVVTTNYISGRLSETSLF